MRAGGWGHQTWILVRPLIGTGILVPLVERSNRVLTGTILVVDHHIGLAGLLRPDLGDGTVIVGRDIEPLGLLTDRIPPIPTTLTVEVVLDPVEVNPDRLGLVVRLNHGVRFDHDDFVHLVVDVVLPTTVVLTEGIEHCPSPVEVFLNIPFKRDRVKGEPCKTPPTDLPATHEVTGQLSQGIENIHPDPEGPSDGQGDEQEGQVGQHGGAPLRL